MTLLNGNNISISEKDFSSAYQSSVEEIISLMPNDWSSFSKHNIDWDQDAFDAKRYLIDSEIRYRKALNYFIENKCTQILDVGGFLAAFPLTMAKLGFSVSIAEKFAYYGTALDQIANYLTKSNIEIIDCDFTSPVDDLSSHITNKFDGISCMAVAEHLAHSPKPLMENINLATSSSGHLVFEVPNIAFWPNRYSLFFRGRTVHPNIESVYHSSIPFTGHHREYTLDDARYVLTEGGFSIIDEDLFNYSLNNLNLLHQVYILPARLFRRCAGIIMIHAVKK